MLRAEQIAVENQARQQLLQIREKELNYFVGNFSSFGTQAALIAGFSLSSITSINTEEFQSSSLPKAFFHITTCLTIASSIHCLLNTTFAAVWGPGLALRGPAGSMVKAVDGMIREKNQIFASFVLCIFSFTLQAICIAWVVMDVAPSIVSSIILTLGGIIMYQYSARIFTRFRLPEESYHSDWAEGAGITDLPGAKAAKSSKPEKVSESQTSMMGGSYHHPTNANISSFIETVAEVGLNVKESGLSRPMSTRAAVDSEAGQQTVDCAGYLMKKSGGLMEMWQRRFFVLSGHELRYYKQKEDYIEHKQASRDRPIDLRGFEVETSQGEFSIRPISDDDERRPWIFKAETQAEKDMWISALRNACN